MRQTVFALPAQIPDGVPPVVPASSNRLSSGGTVGRRRRPETKLIPSMVKVYKLYASATATASNCCNLQLGRAGRLLSCCWHISGLSGAAVTGYQRWELSLSSVSQIATHDTPGNSLAGFACSEPIAVAGFAATGVSAIGVDIAAGDKLYLHVNVQGQAPTNNYIECWVAVQH